jgi:small subunit ribosomal protein S18
MSEDRNASAGAADGAKKTFFRRRKSCPFSGPNGLPIDWKDPKMLGRFISERGKMMPSRITSVCMKKQRELAQAIKRARFMALLPYVRTESEPREYRSEGRGEYRGGSRGERN